MLFAIEPSFFALIDLGIFAAILIIKLPSLIMRIADEEDRIFITF